MKFFGSQRMQTHIDMKAPRRTAKGDRKVTILFRITLNGNTVKSAPDVVKWAYEGVKMKGEDHVGIKKEVENIIVEVFSLEESKRSNMRLRSLYLQRLAVKEISSSKGDTSIVLTFQADYDWDETFWRWMGDVYKTDVFLEFDAAQATLLDIEEEETKGEDAPDEAVAADAANGKPKGKQTSFNIEEFKDKEAEKSGKDAAVGE